MKFPFRVFRGSGLSGRPAQRLPDRCSGLPDRSCSRLLSCPRNDPTATEGQIEPPRTPRSQRISNSQERILFLINSSSWCPMCPWWHNVFPQFAWAHTNSVVSARLSASPALAMTTEASNHEKHEGHEKKTAHHEIPFSRVSWFCSVWTVSAAATGLLLWPARSLLVLSAFPALAMIEWQPKGKLNHQGHQGHKELPIHKNESSS